MSQVLLIYSRMSFSPFFLLSMALYRNNLFWHFGRTEDIPDLAFVTSRKCCLCIEEPEGLRYLSTNIIFWLLISIQQTNPKLIGLKTILYHLSKVEDWLGLSEGFLLGCVMWLKLDTVKAWVIWRWIYPNGFVAKFATSVWRADQESFSFCMRPLLSVVISV